MHYNQEISMVEMTTEIGFLYWLHESHDLRGLKSVSIQDYPAKLEELQEVYLKKYPNGLTGWDTYKDGTPTHIHR